MEAAHVSWKEFKMFVEDVELVSMVNMGNNVTERTNAKYIIAFILIN